jgi:hypothetical protein
VSNPEVKALVAAGVTSAATALGLPPIVVPALVDLLETLAGAPDVLEAIARAKQNGLADAEDAAAVAAADLILKRGH